MNRALPAAFDPSILATLACPACHGNLRAEDSRLICTSCQHAYPILDGIPVLIARPDESPYEAH